jgi:hypothetical protein
LADSLSALDNFAPLRLVDGVAQKKKIDEFVKSRCTVMPDLIRHPEHIEMTGFRLSPE